MLIPHREVAVLVLQRGSGQAIEGSFQSVRWDAKGLRANDRPKNVTGTGNHGRVSIHIGGGLISQSVILTGQVSGNALTLQRGDATAVFQRSDVPTFQSKVERIQRYWNEQHALAAADAAWTKLLRQGDAINADLDRYATWGAKRLTFVPVTQRFYVNRVANYRKCLNTITPLAARGVPSWQWQSCVLDINNDEYARSVERNIFGVRLKQQTQWKSAFASHLMAFQRATAADRSEWLSACGAVNGSQICAQQLQFRESALAAHRPDPNRLVRYGDLTQKVDAALATEINEVQQGDAELGRLKAQVDALYEKAG